MFTNVTELVLMRAKGSWLASSLSCLGGDGDAGPLAPGGMCAEGLATDKETYGWALLY